MLLGLGGLLEVLRYRCGRVGGGRGGSSELAVGGVVVVADVDGIALPLHAHTSQYISRALPLLLSLMTFSWFLISLASTSTSA